MVPHQMLAMSLVGTQMWDISLITWDIYMVTPNQEVGYMSDWGRSAQGGARAKQSGPRRETRKEGHIFDRRRKRGDGFSRHQTLIAAELAGLLVCTC